MERSSLFSISIHCPALNLKGTWVLQLAGQVSELIRECLSKFLDVLRSSGAVTVEKQGDLSAGQVLLIDSLLYKRLREWEEKMKDCQRIEREKENWERRVNDMRIEYIREIEMYRLKLRCLQQNKAVSDERSSSMRKSANASTQTEMKAPIGELVSVWEKCFELQARMDAMHQRNADFAKVDEHLSLLHHQVSDQEGQVMALQKALVELSGASVERQAALELAMREVDALATLSSEGRDLTLIGRDELCPADLRPKPAELLADLEEALTLESRLELQTALKWRPPQQHISQTVAELKDMMHALAGSGYDSDSGERLLRGEVAGATAAVLGRGAWPEAPNDDRVEAVWDALSATKDLHDTLQTVRSASAQWRSFIKEAPSKPSVMSSVSEVASPPTEPAPAPTLSEPKILELLREIPREVQPAPDEEEEQEPKAAAQRAVADELPKRGAHFQAEEMFVEPMDTLDEMAQAGSSKPPPARSRPASATSDVTLATSEPDQPAANLTQCNAETMTPAHFAVQALLASEDVAWTSVPLGKAKDFHWSLMPCLPSSDSECQAQERHRIREGFDRMQEILERAEPTARQRGRSLPPQVLAGTAPGVDWPSISPSAWSRIGGGLELGRLHSEPRGAALRAALRARAEGEEEELHLEDAPSEEVVAPEAPPIQVIRDRRPPPLPGFPVDVSCAEVPAATAATADLTAVGQSVAVVPTEVQVEKSMPRFRSRQRPTLVDEPEEMAKVVEDRVAEEAEEAEEEPEPGPAPPEEELSEPAVTAVATEPWGVHQVRVRRRLTQEEQQDEESGEIVERWLEMLRRPLPMVEKLEAALVEEADATRRNSALLSLRTCPSLQVRPSNSRQGDDDALNKEELQQHWLRLTSPVGKSELDVDGSGVTALSPNRGLPSLPSRPSTARPGSRPTSAPHAAGATGAAQGIFRHWSGRQSSAGTPPKRGKEARPTSAPVVAEVVEPIPRAPALTPRSRLRRMGRPATPARGRKRQDCIRMAYVVHRPSSAGAANVSHL